MSYLDAITEALAARGDVQGWTVRHIISRGSQLYAVPAGIEAQRDVVNERYVVDVLRDTTAGGEPAVGAANVTLLPGEDIGKALNAVTLRASLVRNRPHTIPAPAEMPDVPLADTALQSDRLAALEAAYERLRAATREHPEVKVTAAEFYAAEETTHICNSRGIDAQQVATTLDVEWVLIARRGEQEVETFIETTWRRAADFDIAAELARRAALTVDLLSATPPLAYTGPVVLRGRVLAEYMTAGVIQTLGDAGMKFAQASTWEIGQPVFRGEMKGDPLNLWANRQLPYGVHSSRFDDEGLPGQRLALIVDNRLAAWSAAQRYADYLGIPPTGAFGDVEVAAGTTPARDLLSEPHVEIVAFSWFNPDEITGDFASEIRLGYVVEGGKRTPFKGGMLVGNYLDALADVRWSAETGFEGSYQGPLVARFGNLTVAA